MPKPEYICADCGELFRPKENICHKCGGQTARVHIGSNSRLLPKREEQRTHAHANYENKDFTTTSASSNSLKNIGGILAVVILIGGGYYFLCNSSAESISITVTDWKYEISFGIYSIELTTEFVYNGFFELTLSERELTLYINDINLGTIGFSESWEKFKPGWKNEYTGKYLISDEEDIEELTSASTYNMHLKYKALAQVGIVKKYIEIREESSSSVQHR